MDASTIMGTPDQLGQDIALLARDLTNKHALPPTGVVPQVINGFSIDEAGRILKAEQATINGGSALYYRASTNQVITTGVTPLTTIIFNGTIFTDATYYTLNTGTGVLTFNITGHYSIMAHAEFASNATGRRILEINQHGSVSYLVGNDIRIAVSGDHTPLHAAGFANIVAGDTLDANVFQNSGGNLNLLTGDNYTSLHVTKIG